MATPRAYLDHNASVPLRAQARAAMLAALEAGGNASSVHAEGRAARRCIEEARAAVASLVGASPSHVFFTSGATEAAATLLTPNWRMGRSPVSVGRLIVAASDHPCLLSGGRFAPEQVERVPVDRDGILRLDALRMVLARHDPADGVVMVAVHLANNETGVIQPVAGIAEAVAAAGGILVLDAVQAAGRIPLDIAELSADFLILSSHKIGGPPGVGAIVGKGDLLMPAPLIPGGGQERGHRGGTENVPAIAGFGAAARAARQELSRMGAVRDMRDGMERAIRSREPEAEIHGVNAERLPNTCFFTLPGLKAETAQIAFDLAGVAVSAGSACSSGKVGPSHVLEAMGHGGGTTALRVSIGAETTVADVELFQAALTDLLARRDRTRAA